MGDRRGITVRNTFLEFEDSAVHDFADTGFQRQLSEPVKSLYRNVSEQTTTGSEMTLEGQESNSTTEPDESFMQCLFMVQNGTMMVEAMPGTCGAISNNASRQLIGMGSPMIGMGASNFCSQIVENSHQTAATPALANPQVQQPQSNQVTIVRFCPNCGNKVEPTHSFCPYCCFNLQQLQLQNSQPSTTVQQGPSMRCTMFRYTQQQSCTPAGGSAPQQPKLLGSETADMLGSIKRFRYIEASTTDIERARSLLCETLMRGM